MYFSFILRLFFSPLTHLLFICLFCVFFVFFYLFFSFFFCAVHWISQHIPKRKTKRKIQNPNSKIQIKKRRSVSAQHVSAQQLRPQKLKHLNPLLPFILLKKIGLFAPYFFIVSCHQNCGVLHGILVHDRSPPRIKTIFCFCKFISTVSKMSSWKSPKKCAKFGS